MKQKESEKAWQFPKYSVGVNIIYRMNVKFQNKIRKDDRLSAIVFILYYIKFCSIRMELHRYISAFFDGKININKIREIAGHEDKKTNLNNYCVDRRTVGDTKK